MKLNVIEQEIMEIIKQDIESSFDDFSTLTNNEIAKEIDISVFSVRDKILSLSKKGAIIKRNNVWDKSRKFHNRIIYLK